jgi:hypothetical protein
MASAFELPRERERLILLLVTDETGFLAVTRSEFKFPVLTRCRTNTTPTKNLFLS